MNQFAVLYESRFARPTHGGEMSWVELWVLGSTGGPPAAWQGPVRIQFAEQTISETASHTEILTLPSEPMSPIFGGFFVAQRREPSLT